MASVFELANSVSIFDVIAKYTDVNPSSLRRGLTHCPICGNGHNSGCFGLYKKDSSEVNRFKCFSCNATGNAVSLVSLVNDSTKGDVLESAKLICKDFNISYDTSNVIVNKDFETYKAVYSFLAEKFQYYYVTDRNPNINYFKERGLSDKTIKDYQLGYCPDYFIQGGRVVSLKDLLLKKFPDCNLSSLGLLTNQGDCILAGRYIFPIKNQFGDIIAFSGRACDSNNPIKYINTKCDGNPYFYKAYTLYNFDKAKSYSSIIVVEGFMDALSLIDSGVENVVASMGTAFGNTHLSLLKNKNIILALDNDSAGQSRTLNIIETYRDRFFKVLVQYAYKDFNEALMAGEDLKDYIKYKSLLDAPEFLVEYFKTHSDLSNKDNRNILAIRLAKLIGSINPAKQKQYPINLIYTDLDLDYYWKRTMRLFKGKRGN